MKDNTGDTALHKAMRGGHLEIFRMLVRLLDSELDFSVNNNRETPLYLAAEFGFYDAFIEIMNVCKKPTNVAGPSKRTPLHAAVIQEHEASEGDILMIQELLHHCPDCWDMVNGEGQMHFILPY